MCIEWIIIYMVKVKILDLADQKYLKDKAEISLVSEEDIRVDIVHEVVRWQTSNSRLATKAVKNESEVSGSTRKRHRQKGTGRARMGSGRAPHIRGGAVTHDVRTNYSLDLNKKIRKLGLKHAISNRYYNEALIVIDSSDDAFNKLPDKTNKIQDLLNCFKEDSLLFVIPNNTINKKLELFMRGCKNLHKVNFIKACGLNVHDIIKNNRLFVFSNAVNELEDRL